MADRPIRHVDWLESNRWQTSSKGKENPIVKNIKDREMRKMPNKHQLRSEDINHRHRTYHHNTAAFFFSFLQKKNERSTIYMHNIEKTKYSSFIEDIITTKRCCIYFDDEFVVPCCCWRHSYSHLVSLLVCKLSPHPKDDGTYRRWCHLWMWFVFFVYHTKSIVSHNTHPPWISSFLSSFFTFA